MKAEWLLVVGATVLASSRTCCARPDDEFAHSERSRILVAREVISESDISGAYDYVIAGGGLAGLVLASRLSEKDNTVLVLEAGLSGDAVADRINTPSGAFYESIVGTEYDWGHVTVPQPDLNNRAISWPRGKILGGSSAMNALYLVRPSEQEVNAWQQVISSDDKDAATRWGWNEMFATMKKVENFTEPLPQVAAVGNIQWNASAYGSGGPVSISYPGVMMQIVGNWTSALNATGIPPQPNPNAGVTMGGFITPSSINPTNWTRSYSRSAYIDSLPPRPNNLHILPETTVTRVLFREQASTEGWIADRVEFAPNARSPRRTVRVRREVILSGGTAGSPKMLMHSGFGPRDVLESAGVVMIEELPGVGQHVKDHLTAGVVWESRLETAGNIHDSGSDFAKSPEFLSFINDAVAFVNITRLLGTEGASGLHTQIVDALQNYTTSLPPISSSSSSSTAADVVEGSKIIYNLRANTFFEQIAQVELLMGLTGSGTVSIQSALQHPFSQGRIYINSSDPFEPVIIDPRYFSHFADVTIMRQGIKVVRDLGRALGDALGAEVSPGPSVQTDEDIEGWLRSEGANSQFHPSSSCGMLPRAQGGVVNSKLRVYGAANVRVVDSSVFPFEFAAHLASSTYGLAEQAALIIQAEGFTVPNTGGPRNVHSISVPILSLIFATLTAFQFLI